MLGLNIILPRFSTVLYNGEKIVGCAGPRPLVFKWTRL